jgi:hypothetical protein
MITGLGSIISPTWTHSCQRSATFAAHPPRLAARFRANGSHPVRAADSPPLRSGERLTQTVGRLHKAKGRYYETCH